MNQQNNSTHIPITVITGFLGAGKTTLLNRILSVEHGKRIAVIENEFGEIGIDNELIINADEEIFEMNNGCICCTVRGDLIRILGRLMKRKDRFDHIMIETTGLADPAPVVQTFFSDNEMKEKFRVDAIITVVDARHVLAHLDENEQCKKQIAFADVILLNKIDLLSAGELPLLEKRIHAINRPAKIFTTSNAAVEVDKLLNIRAFDLEKTLELDPDFLKEEKPFEWAGLYELKAGTHQISLTPGPDPSMLMVAMPALNTSHDEFHHLEEHALEIFQTAPEPTASGAVIVPSSKLLELTIGSRAATYTLDISQPGAYGLFTQHAPDEFDMKLLWENTLVEPRHEEEFAAAHHHDDSISSVGIDIPGDLDPDRFNDWLSKLLKEKGADIFRMKGIVSIKDEPAQFVFQGVHMIFDGQADRPWGTRPRRNQIVFIGRHLDRESLNAGFNSCLVSSPGTRPSLT